MGWNRTARMWWSEVPLEVVIGVLAPIALECTAELSTNKPLILTAASTCCCFNQAVSKCLPKLRTLQINFSAEQRCQRGWGGPQRVSRASLELSNRAALRLIGRCPQLQSMHLRLFDAVNPSEIALMRHLAAPHW